MVDRRRNSTLKLYCLSLHCLTRAQSAPQSLQRARAVFTPNPQPIQGIVPPPFAILALWVLQYFPIQLLPHTSVFPNNSHSQMFVPLMLTIVYILKIVFSLNANNFFYCEATLVGGPARGVERALCLVSPLLVGSCALVVHVCRPGVFGVHKELPRECMYEKSVFRTCRIGVIVYVGRACFSYMHNWGPSACRCGMFFVQAAPEPPLSILLALKFNSLPIEL